MNKEKQIEEMASVLCADCAASSTPCGHQMCDAVWQQAEALYTAGYRKQSEWISVDERLPEKDGIYLVCLSGLPADFDRFVVYEDDDIENSFEHSKVTHWLPIPEAPKKKGGKE